ncbi:hypothetical protein M569_11506 [Genlisea aurea]|uniref:Uncharacterized protein n=1 Tax=Genlisea aurea TaxID=192259 RepID=S8C8W6_9LAMI|nr:hypothetical protein M569_11506 [Genlisea aurea]
MIPNIFRDGIGFKFLMNFGIGITGTVSGSGSVSRMLTPTLHPLICQVLTRLKCPPYALFPNGYVYLAAFIHYAVASNKDPTIADFFKLFKPRAPIQHSESEEYVGRLDKLFHLDYSSPRT